MRDAAARVRSSGLLLLGSAIIAIALAAVWIRTPALWPPLPDVFWHSIDNLFGAPTSQGQVADREFLVFWVSRFSASFRCYCAP